MVNTIKHKSKSGTLLKYLTGLGVLGAKVLSIDKEVSGVCPIHGSYISLLVTLSIDKTTALFEFKDSKPYIDVMVYKDGLVKDYKRIEDC